MASELKVDTIKHTNNTSAITLDTSGNVTLAGSANNVGTVSAGTFNGTLGSSATFPAGHVVQTVSDIFNNSTAVTTYTTVGTHIEKNITITAGNKVAFNFCIPTRHLASGYHYGQFEYFIYHKVGSSGSYAEMNSGKRQAMYYYDQYGAMDTDFYRYSSVQMSGVHTPSSGTEQYYKVYAKLVQGNDVTVGINTGTDTTVILQEIQS